MFASNEKDGENDVKEGSESASKTEDGVAPVEPGARVSKYSKPSLEEIDKKKELNA